MIKRTKKQKALQKELFDLQKNGTLTWTNFRKSNFEFYKHIAEIYFWWVKASKVEDYLEVEYAKLARHYKTKVVYGTNYSPLLWIVWGENQCSTSDSDRHSRALNAIDNEYLKRKRYYSKDKVVKMAKYIESNNGIYGLCGYGLAKEDETEIDELIAKKQKQASTKSGIVLSQKEREIVAYDIAKTYYSNSTIAPTVDFGTELPTNADELSLILVRKTASGYQLLGTTNNEDLVRASAIVNFKNNFNAMPIEVKCIVEAIRSQAFPLSMLKDRKYLIETDKVKNGKHKYRRLVYRSLTQDFLLSSVRTNVGVVTVVKPHFPILNDIVQDVFLSPLSINIIESRLLATKDFNGYQKVSTKHNNILNELGVAKLIRLQNIFDYSDFINLDFWQFDSNINLPLTQANVAEDALTKLNWEHTIDIGFFRRIALDLIDKWFLSHSKYIKREEGKLCQLTFSQNEIAIEFVYKNSKFEQKHIFQLPIPNRKLATTTLKFNTKEIMLVLRSIADYDAKNICIKANNNILQFEFINATATISISVPTLNYKGERNKQAFNVSTFKAFPLASAAYETTFADENPLLIGEMETV